MPYKFTDQSLEEYQRDGLTILRDLIPGSLLTDLRRESETARQIAHRISGPQAQRLQPVQSFPELSAQLFDDFLDLPGLGDAVQNILGPGHSREDNMGILFEPVGEAWATQWHRDWGYNVAPMDIDEFFKRAQDLHLFNQLNAALYLDSSLWVVPGSHIRRDTPEEVAAFGMIPPDPPALDGLGGDERDLECARYCRRMPGAVQVVLQAGDCAFYRNPGWHLGSYVPYAKRATLHSGFYCDADRDWWAYVKAYQDKVLAAAS